MNEEDQKLLAKRLVEQAFEIWINPEIEKRKSEGTLPTKPQRLLAAQIILSVGGPNIVRLNEEVKVFMNSKFNKDIKAGDPVKESDIEDINGFELIPEEKDFAHITIIFLKEKTFVGFSFIYDVSKSEKILQIANQFMKSANADLKTKLYRPFIESLHIAAENLAKARIYLLPDKEIRSAKRHGIIQAKVNIYSKNSNIIKSSQKDAFNNLSRLRDKARYEEDFSLTEDHAKELYKQINSLQHEVQILIQRFNS